MFQLSALRQVDWMKVGTLLLFAAFLILLFTNSAYAAGHGEDFSTLYDTIVAWTTGSLGKSIAISFLLCGLFLGLARGSLVAALTCIGCSLVLILAPDLITAISTKST